MNRTKLHETQKLDAFVIRSKLKLP